MMRPGTLGREHVFGTLLLALAALLQGSGLFEFGSARLRPDLGAICVASWSYLASYPAGFVWAMIGGLFLDALSAGPFLHQVLALCCCSAASGLVRTLADSQSQTWGLAAVTFGLFVFLTTDAFLLHLKGWHILSAHLFSTILVPVFLVDLGLSVLVLSMLRRVHSLLRPVSSIL